MTVLVYCERDAEGNVDEVSLQGVAFARAFAPGESVEAVVVDDASFAPDAWAGVIAAASGNGERAATIVGPGTERGSEVLARVAAILDVPFAANCTTGAIGEPCTVTRVRWGGSLLEEARVHGPVRVLSVAPHSVAADGAVVPEHLMPVAASTLPEVRVSERVSSSAGGVSLADAKVVVTGGRGVGSAEGFAPIEDLAGLLGAAVGCSRAVTMAGWRPHTDQVGQTGTKIAPEIYIPCGVSGATQHLAGARGAKRMLAINKDAEAPIMSTADYAVLGDLHEVVPAIAAEIRRRRG